jgi:hypothetical protein
MTATYFRYFGGFHSYRWIKQRCKPLPSIGNSDHDIVLLDVACKPVKPKPTRQKIYLWKKAEVHNIQNDIAEFGSIFKNETHQNIESMWQSLEIH